MGLTMISIPTTIKRTQIIRIRLIMCFERQISRTHDGLTQVINAVQEMDVVIPGEAMRVLGHDAGVDSSEHVLCQTGAILAG